MTTKEHAEFEVLIGEECPHAHEAVALAETVAGLVGDKLTVSKTVVSTPADAAARRMSGSPTFLVDGLDVAAEQGPGEPTTACRTYEGEAGVPPRWLVEAAVIRALGPRGLLFLCVANSARSQMAEGIARHLAPAGVEVRSAGSRPSRVRPEAVAALAEVGIDISQQRSKSVTEIPPAEVDVVVTLCGEEECPLFLGDAIRLHWELPDPAAEPGDVVSRFDAFRRTRDELRRRISRMLPGPGREA